MRIMFILCLACCSTALGSIQIEWSSTPGGVDLQSDGVTVIDDSFEFLLGSFDGIVPTADNVSEWEGAFQVFGTAPYFPTLSRFQRQISLESNDSPFTTSTRAYVWGRNGTGPGSEWILFGKPSWTWPNANPVGPALPVRWLVFSITPADVVLGTVNADGVQMKTVQVDLSLTYQQWTEVFFEPGDDASGGSDFDGDGRSNFLEYAAGSNPKAVDGPFEPELIGVDQLVIPRAAGREVEWVIYQSENLQGFEEVTSGVEVVADDADRLVLRMTTSSGPRRFFRVEARPTG